MSGDVSERLAAGESALGTVATYVAACRALGRPVGGVTVAGVRDTYSAEAGLRLRALDADSAALAGLARAAEDGLRVEREVLATLADAWQGRSGDAAAEFVERHCAQAATLAAGLRRAAEVLRSLRVELGGLIDEKVGAAVDIDNRRAAEHPGWLTEARAVLDGVADDVAIEVVARQIGPYVDGDIAADLMPSMQAGTDSVAAAYEAALARLSERSDSAAAWSDHGRGATESQPQQTVTPAVSAPTTQSAPLPSPSTPWSAGFPSGLPTGLPGFGGTSGLGGFGGALPALIGRIADQLGRYTDAPDAVGRDRTAPNRLRKKDDADTKETEAQDKSEREADAGKAPVGGEPVPQADSTSAPASVLPDAPVVTVAPPPPLPAGPSVFVPVAAPPTSTTSPPPTSTTSLPPTPPAMPTPTSMSPPPPTSTAIPHVPTVPRQAPLAAEAPAAEKTPCAIAADELPQVGQ